MKENNYILAVDQGTSGTKALIFNREGILMAKATAPLKSIYLIGGMVEQNPEEIYENVLKAVRECLDVFRDNGFDPNAVISCGISNQRETFLIWDKNGKPFHNAVVWQCKRSIGICDRLLSEGKERLIKEKTGLIIDPYFSGTKLMWLKENNPQISRAIKDGEVYFGTVDTWLLYRLTKGNKYITDHTNASRTMFFNLHNLGWELTILVELGLEGLNLPKIQASSSHFGSSNFDGLFGQEISIQAMIGDSHAAAFGEECFSPGTAKATLGTGCSILMNIGDAPKPSAGGLVNTICWSTEDRVDYALEGVIVTCGGTIEWLKNELGIITDVRDTAHIAAALETNNGVYLVPAFSGLGAPYWEMDRKASITGLTFDCNKNHIIRAALESIPFQIKDVIAAMEKDSGIVLDELMVDGGISSNHFVMGFLASLLEKPVSHIEIADVSGMGAAYLAGLKAGIYPDIESLQKLQSKITLSIEMDPEAVKLAYKGWQNTLKVNKN